MCVCVCVCVETKRVRTGGVPLQFVPTVEVVTVVIVVECTYTLFARLVSPRFLHQPAARYAPRRRIV